MTNNSSLPISGDDRFDVVEAMVDVDGSVVGGPVMVDGGPVAVSGGPVLADRRSSDGARRSNLSQTAVNKECIVQQMKQNE